MKTDSIPASLEHWARWCVFHPDGVRGFAGASLVADRYRFQVYGVPKLNPLGELMLTARGNQTQVMHAPTLEEDEEAETIDSGITLMGRFRPDLQLVVLGEYLGVYVEMNPESYRPAHQQLNQWQRVIAVWMTGRGFTIRHCERRSEDTLERWRERLRARQGLKRGVYHRLLEQAHVYLSCWLDVEAVAKAGRIAA